MKHKTSFIEVSKNHHESRVTKLVKPNKRKKSAQMFTL